MYGALVQVMDILNTIKKDLCQKKFIHVSFSTSHEGGKALKGKAFWPAFLSFWFNLTKNFLIEVELIDNVVLISDVWQLTRLYTHTFLYSFP